MFIEARIAAAFVFISLPFLAACTSGPVLGAQTPASSSGAALPIGLPSPAPTALPDSPPPSPQAGSADEEIKLLFTGQIVPGRCVQAGVDEHGSADYIYEDIRPTLRSPDLTIGTVNGSISDYSKPMGCVAWTFILNGTPPNADALARAGFDGVSVATNHINNCSNSNCGYRPFQDTLANLRRVGVVPIGGGENLQEALKPVLFEVKGVKFAVVSLGEIEKKVFAGEDHPGIAVLNAENLRSSIAAARKMADVVIFMPHWGPEYSPLPNPNQQRYAALAVEAGADLVIGNHPHVIQGMQEIEGVQVFYGLGNFVFDQDWELRLRSSLLVEVTFRHGAYQGYRLIPVVSAKNGKVSPADPTQAAEILESFNEATRKIKSLERP